MVGLATNGIRPAHAVVASAAVPLVEQSMIGTRLLRCGTVKADIARTFVVDRPVEIIELRSRKRGPQQVRCYERSPYRRVNVHCVQCTIVHVAAY